MRRFFTFILLGLFFQHISAQHLSNGSAESLPQATAINEQADAIEARVYPNPVSSKLYFNVSERIAGSTVRVYNLLGSEVMNYELAGTHDAIEVSSLQGGIYLYSIIDKNDKTLLSGKFNKE